MGPAQDAAEPRRHGTGDVQLQPGLPIGTRPTAPPRRAWASSRRPASRAARPATARRPRRRRSTACTAGSTAPMPAPFTSTTRSAMTVWTRTVNAHAGEATLCVAMHRVNAAGAVVGGPLATATHRIAELAHRRHADQLRLQPLRHAAGRFSLAAGRAAPLDPLARQLVAAGRDRALLRPPDLRHGAVRGHDHPPSMIRKLHRRLTDPAGFAMPIVIVVSMVLMIVAAVAVTSGLNATTSSNRDRQVKVARQAADAGLELALYHLNAVMAGQPTLPCVTRRRRPTSSLGPSAGAVVRPRDRHDGRRLDDRVPALEGDAGRGHLPAAGHAQDRRHGHLPRPAAPRLHRDPRDPGRRLRSAIVRDQREGQTSSCRTTR